MLLPELPDGFAVRRPTVDDAQLVYELMVACDIAEYGEADSDVNDILGDWEGIDLSRDGWMVLGVDGRLAGYVVAIGRGPGRFKLDYYAHPDHESDELIAFLIATLEPRMAELATDGTALVEVIIPSVKERDPALLAAAGYQLERHYFRMWIGMDESPAAPVWPDGLTLRNVVPGEDDEGLFEFVMDAFDWPGREEMSSFERWRDYMMRPDHFIPELWFVVYSGGELVGAALCFDYIDYGWVRQLAVRKDWRGRSLGAALLRHVFGVFYERGRRQVALVVNAENANAQAFYKRVGMKMVRQYDEYRKPIRSTEN